MSDSRRRAARHESRTRQLLRTTFRAAASTALLSAVIGIASGGCLSRPVTSREPTIKDNFTKSLRQSNIDKVDILFDIDNSASMGDKEKFLSQAVPDFLNRLLSPQCVDDQGKTLTGTDGKILTSDKNGTCAQGQPEFKPVHDMHIGVVTSSLGARGGNIAGCEDSGGAGSSNDRGELITRGAKGPVADSSASNFLAWFPSDVDANKDKSPTPSSNPIGDKQALRDDFADLVVGVGQNGCGIESQLESWYRFLIQPDPWDTISVDSTVEPPQARLNGIDETIIKQRHDFLRPDSLVAVIDLTDENDSEIDSRSVLGTGWRFLIQNTDKPGAPSFNPPRGTSICATNPADPGCQSCAFGGSGDPSCATNGGVYTDPADWGFDPNLRHVHPKQKYGLDPQFPIDRYFDGLTQTRVPDRNGEYPSGAGSYVGDAKCTNPLFAASLPADASDSNALCNMPHGTRTPDLVFFGIIGGVPNQLLHYDPKDPASINLTAADWTKILGKDPEHYDYSGIDPHMIESFEPRVPGSTGYPSSVASHTDYNGTSETDIQAATGANDADPWNGREWITNTPGAPKQTMPFAVDRQYACIFKLDTPRDCKDGSLTTSCDCPSTPPPTLPAGAIPPVCDSADPTKQTYAKVYPTPRELLLAKKMSEQQGGKQNQGIAASLCPIHTTDNATGDDPLYGYRPAVSAIVERLKNALAAQCLPTALTPDANGNVPCLILEALPPGSTCDPNHGLTPADPKQAANYLATLRKNAGGGDAGSDLAGYTVCRVGQLLGGDLDSTGGCSKSEKAGWCYVTGANAGSCAQAIKFSSNGSPPTGARVSLQCIQQTGDTSGNGASGAAGGG